MIAITNGRVVTVTGDFLDGGTVLIEGNKIAAVGTAVAVPADARVIDASGKWVTPGFIDAHTHISCHHEPSTIPPNYDNNELCSPITPQVRVTDALNPRDPAIANVRRAGFTTCYTTPGSGNLIGGTGISFKTKDAATSMELAIPGSEMMKFALGENPKRCYGKDGKMPVTRMGNAALVRETLTRARHYAEALAAAEADPEKKRPEPDFMLDALVPVVRGQMKVRIHCHRADDIVTAVRLSEEFGLDYSIEHVTEGYRIADFLAEKNPDMIVGPLTMGPMKMEIWNASLKNPAVLEQAGCDHFCLTEDGTSSTAELPANVGLCIARGLSLPAALRALTINPARLLKLADRIGSLEPGKDADVAIWNGNPFSNRTLCEQTIIDGVVYENGPFRPETEGMSR